MLLRKVVIFARYSTDMQNPKSCDDQAREVHQKLREKGINSTNAMVIQEDAESGTRSDRTGFSRIVEMVARGEAFLLAVDDQSRFSRADNAYSFITDLGRRPFHFHWRRHGYRRDRVGIARQGHGTPQFYDD
jgi:site-specific DNA recombinase